MYCGLLSCFGIAPRFQHAIQTFKVIRIDLNEVQTADVPRYFPERVVETGRSQFHPGFKCILILMYDAVADQTAREKILKQRTGIAELAMNNMMGKKRLAMHT
jgi:hypothetical protein